MPSWCDRLRARWGALSFDRCGECRSIVGGARCESFRELCRRYNNIDVVTATKLGIRVTNTPGVLTDATADMAWALLMSIARRIVESDRFTREGRFERVGAEDVHGGDITGRTLGIIGAGRIGAAFCGAGCGV